MCVITISHERHPTSEEIEKMGSANPDGIGILWSNKKSKTNEWIKGLTTKQAINFYKKNSEILPIGSTISHYRLASVGRGHDKTLNHPFVIDEHATNKLKGLTKKSLLVHNGHWSDWSNLMLTLPSIPKGSFSDTRCIALLINSSKNKASYFGSQKLAILNNLKIDTYGQFEEYKGLICSNTHWNKSNSYFLSNPLNNQSGDYRRQTTLANKRKSEADIIDETDELIYGRYGKDYISGW